LTSGSVDMRGSFIAFDIFWPLYLRLLTRDTLSATKAQRAADAVHDWIDGMSKGLGNLGGTMGAVLAGGVMCAALAIGAYIGLGGVLDPEVPPHTAVSVQRVPEELPRQTSAPEEAPATQEALATEEILAAEEAPTAATAAPSFDEVRRDPDGMTIIAGRAAPLSEVEIVVDGATVATAQADTTGGFAAIAVLPPKNTAQVVSLSAKIGEVATASRDEIILAPMQPRLVPPVQATALPSITDTAGIGADIVSDIAPATPPQAPIAQAPTEAGSTVEGDIANDTAAETSAPQVPERVAVLKSDETGVSLLTQARPDAMTEVVLDTIGYSDFGDVQLSGRAQADTAKVRVYLDNRAVITLPVGTDGRWRGDLPDVDEGVYTLRVDEMSAAGEVRSRVETPFKRESAEVLAQAQAEADGPITSITVQTGATLWAIARDRYGDGMLFVRVFEANADNIRDPDLIYPGQVFDLPD
jgi:nucleoid-associated protein YgaU